jgi:hypothetical protein
MGMLLALTALAPAQAGGARTFVSMKLAARVLASEVQTGTLIASQGPCVAVKVFSDSKYTHVAAVVVENKVPYVYESTSGPGVRKLPLEDYLRSQNPAAVFLLHPQKPLTERQRERFVEHLESELGRPYGIKHHLTGERAEGIHCAEYVIDALVATRLMKVNRAPRVSPGSLVKGVVRAGRYHGPQALELKQPPPPRPKGRNWCDQLWIDTKVCTGNCCRKFKGWILCR